MITEAEILRALVNAKVGDSILFKFVGGRGRKGKMGEEERVAFMRFVVMTGITSGPNSDDHHFTFGDKLQSSLIPAEMLAVAHGGTWEMISKERKLVVRKVFGAEDADFYSQRIGPALEAILLIPFEDDEVPVTRRDTPSAMRAVRP